MNPLIDVEKMRIQLPSQWRGRERVFAQAVVEELGKLPVSQDVSLDNIQIPAITIRKGQSHAAVARMVAKQIFDQIQIVSSVNGNAVSGLTENAGFGGQPTQLRNSTTKNRINHA